MSSCKFVLAFVAILLPAVARGQQTPLPDAMHPLFLAGKNYAERMKVSPSTSTDDVEVDMSYESQGEQVVRLNWRARAVGATVCKQETTHETSFLPTAVARHAGRSTTFYVAGWWPRTAQVIVERWDVRPLAVGQTITPGGFVKTTMSTPSIRRSLVWMSASGEMAPVWDAAVLPYSNELWMLESGSTTRIRSLDLETVQVAVVYSSDQSGMAQLQGLRCFSVGKHPVSGFVVMASGRRPWESSQALSSTSAMFVVTDTDCDGIVDPAFFDDFGDYHQLFPAPWELAYSGGWSVLHDDRYPD